MVDGNRVHRGPHEPVTPLAVPSDDERRRAVAPPAVRRRVVVPGRPDLDRVPPQRTRVVVGLAVGEPAAALGADRVDGQFEAGGQEREADEEVVVVRVALDAEHDPRCRGERLDRVPPGADGTRARAFR